MKKDIFVDCSMCGKHLYAGDNYYSFEIGYFKIEKNKETTVINVNELFVWCEKCHKNDFKKRINVMR